MTAPTKYKTSHTDKANSCQCKYVTNKLVKLFFKDPLKPNKKVQRPNMQYELKTWENRINVDANRQTHVRLRPLN